MPLSLSSRIPRATNAALWPISRRIEIRDSIDRKINERRFEIFDVIAANVYSRGVSAIWGSIWERCLFVTILYGNTNSRGCYTRMLQDRRLARVVRATSLVLISAIIRGSGFSPS